MCHWNKIAKATLKTVPAKVARNPKCWALKMQFYLEDNGKHMKIKCDRDYSIIILREKNLKCVTGICW